MYQGTQALQNAGYQTSMLKLPTARHMWNTESDVAFNTHPFRFRCFTQDCSNVNCRFTCETYSWYLWYFFCFKPLVPQEAKQCCLQHLCSIIAHKFKHLPSQKAEIHIQSSAVWNYFNLHFLTFLEHCYQPDLWWEISTLPVGSRCILQEQINSINKLWPQRTQYQYNP